MLDSGLTETTHPCVITEYGWRCLTCSAMIETSIHRRGETMHKHELRYPPVGER